MTIRIEREDKKSDEELISLYSQNRSDEHFSELYKRHFVPLARYISWLCGNQDQAKDIAQTIMLRIYQSPQSFDPSRNFKVWLYSISKNQWKNELRSESVRNKYAENLKVVETQEEDENSESRLKMVQLGLAKLSESHREIFVLKYSNNLSINEISKVCAISEGTVKSRLFYAMKNLKDHINKDLLR